MSTWSRRGAWGSAEHRNTAKKKLTNTASRKKSQRNTVTATRIFRSMIHSSTLKIILSYTSKKIIPNKHITTLFAAHMSILQMPVKKFSCSSKETLRKERIHRKKREEPRELTPPVFYFAHFSWCNPLTGALSWLKVFLSGAKFGVRYR